MAAFSCLDFPAPTCWRCQWDMPLRWSGASSNSYAALIKVREGLTFGFEVASCSISIENGDF